MSSPDPLAGLNRLHAHAFDTLPLTPEQRAEQVVRSLTSYAQQLGDQVAAQQREAEATAQRVHSAATSSLSSLNESVATYEQMLKEVGALTEQQRAFAVAAAKAQSALT